MNVTVENKVREAENKMIQEGYAEQIVDAQRRRDHGVGCVDVYGISLNKMVCMRVYDNGTVYDRIKRA